MEGAAIKIQEGYKGMKTRKEISVIKQDQKDTHPQKQQQNG